MTFTNKMFEENFFGIQLRHLSVSAHQHTHNGCVDFVINYCLLLLFRPIFCCHTQWREHAFNTVHHSLSRTINKMSISINAIPITYLTDERWAICAHFCSHSKYEWIVCNRQTENSVMISIFNSKILLRYGWLPAFLHSIFLPLSHSIWYRRQSC